jgi:hypothetical protein
MTLISIVQSVPFCGYGLWLAVFPQSAIRFYNWMYRRTIGGTRRVMPDPLVVRICGVVLLCVLAVAYWRAGT